ncbi:ubiquinone biosynthesis O-methyltransferase, mitochondrial isoform X2 [Galleria mellonella]|uniref:Ubiquinone biosynthesis O-methyltransferase, mitochondrial n=1 Tax=Galleria mellonella TaxID=7137 RepID=A0A6J1WEE4_GALME|nr:ubiquinone biosynthesis O-methyltransferase, mitochondrial isoform X2 [Galleria mellonella]
MPYIGKIYRLVNLRNESSSNTKRTTIDKPNVEKFTKILQEWWDPNGPIKALHAMNLVRVPFVRDGLIQCAQNERNIKPLKDKKLLDVGCGGGILSEALSKLGAEVTGIDANKELVQLAQYHSNMNDELNLKPKYQYTTIEDHSKDFSNYYDGVVASEVIEHIKDKELFVKSCLQALKPEGRIFFTTPTRSRLCKIFGIWIAEYVMNAIPKGTHQYDMLMTPIELTFLLERNNCHVEIINGLVYNPCTNKWDLIRSQQLLFALQAVKLE